MQPQPPAVSDSKVYRYYNKRNGDHIFITDPVEKASLDANSAQNKPAAPATNNTNKPAATSPKTGDDTPANSGILGLLERLKEWFIDTFKVGSLEIEETSFN